MRIFFKTLFAFLFLSLLCSEADALTSTINPGIPASGAPLSSAPLRQNFGNAYNDINNIYNILAQNNATINISPNTLLGNFTNGTTGALANVVPSCADSSGQHLNYLPGVGLVCGSSGPTNGTVTSVTLTGDGTVLSSTVSSPVTSAGTLTATLAAAEGYGVLSNTSNSSATPLYNTISQIMDAWFGTTQGAIPYRGASSWSALSPGTANQVLLSGGSSANPAYSTATYPATTTANNILFSSANNTISQIATGNSGVLVTSSGGVPSISSTLPSAVQGNITALGTIASGTWHGTAIGATYLPTSTSSALGLVQTDGSTISNSSGTISCTTATSSQIGCSKPDGTILTISAGAETVATATSSALGVAKFGNGLSVSTGNVTLAAPTTSVLGGILAASGATSNSFVTYIDNTGTQHVAQPSFSNISGSITNAQIPAPTTSSLGGIEAASSATSNQFVTYVDTSGIQHTAQPSFSNLSGTATGAQLPSPSPTTIGGVESIAAVTHNFLTSISTSGVPSQAQPAFTDISGTASNAQIPAPTTSALGGIEAASAATSNQFVTYVDTSGVQHTAQPAFSNLSGSASNAQIPAPTTSALGGIQAASSAISNQFMTYVDTSGVQHTAQPATTNLSDIGTYSASSTGTATFASFIPTSSSVPTNGMYLSGTNQVGFASNGSGRVFISSSGQFEMGSASFACTDPSCSIYPQANVTGSSSQTSLSVQRYSADTGSATLWLDKGRGSVSQFTTIVTGDNLGTINFNGADGSHFQEAGQINVAATGTIASGQVPGIMSFSTANGSGTLTTALKIDQNQHLLAEGSAQSTGNLSGCGSSPSIGGNDTVGRITIGSGGGTSCVLTFVNSYATAPICNGMDETTQENLKFTAATGTLTIAGTLNASDKVTYSCIGY